MKMNSALCILSLFLASSLLLFHAESAANDIVEGTCKKITASGLILKYENCVKSLRSDPKSRTVDIQGLGLIALNLLKSNLTGMRPYIQQLLMQKGDWYVKYIMVDCSFGYSASVMTMKDIIGLYQKKRYGEVEVPLVVVSREVDRCESWFNEKRGLPSPLAKQNEELTQLSYIALAILDIVKG